MLYLSVYSTIMTQENKSEKNPEASRNIAKLPEMCYNVNIENNKGGLFMIRYVLFDLDGTLLPMDQDTFVKAYFKELAKKMAPYGYTADGLVSGIWKSMDAMTANDGSRTNEVVFWENFSKVLGQHVLTRRPIFDEFYRNEFNNVSKSCGFTPRAQETIDLIKSLGAKIAIATLPVFPADAIEARINWAGVNKNDLELYTCYENTTFTKPNPQYYNELLGKINANAEECLMVGNNVDEDMITTTLGMKVFLLTDCIINENNADISVYPHGSWNDLQRYIRELRS